MARVPFAFPFGRPQCDQLWNYDGRRLFVSPPCMILSQRNHEASERFLRFNLFTASSGIQLFSNITGRLGTVWFLSCRHHEQCSEDPGTSFLVPLLISPHHLTNLLYRHLPLWNIHTSGHSGRNRVLWMTMQRGFEYVVERRDAINSFSR